MFAPLVVTLVGLYMIFIGGKGDPIIAMITIVTFFWTIYEFFKPELTSSEIDDLIKGKSKMKTRDWVELIILALCFLWIVAAAELS